MQELKYYYEEKGYGDKEAVRFEKGAVELCRYRMSCNDLTYPYTALTWLMIDFLKQYYLQDVEGFKNEADEFWAKADDSAFAHYELIVNRNKIEKARHYCRNVVAIYEKFASEGYNLAKPVPVTENSRGEIVALKGAKRIAALITYGFDWVPVLEFNRKTLARVPWKQRNTSCIDHCSLIFKKMGHIPYVKELEAQYEQQLRNETALKRLATIESLRELTDDRRRSKNSISLRRKREGILERVSDLALQEPAVYSVVIDSNLELIEWFYLRKLPAHLIICNETLSSKLETLEFDSSISISENIKPENILSCAQENESSELWIPENSSFAISDSDAQKMEIKTY
ncbi:MAG TPA: hypothetical protein EYN69_10515 [Flavobacteriales bacterium]|nr:hypothetical protein [Flavobacteriales bacterium]